MRGRRNTPVAILEGLFGPHVNNLSRSLKQTSLRHTLVSENLANVNTPGYKRRDLDFGIALETADSKLKGNRLHGDSKIKVSGGAMRRDGNSVDLESEVAAMAETEFRYKLMTDLTNRYFSGLRNVIREGK